MKSQTRILSVVALALIAAPLASFAAVEPTVKFLAVGNPSAIRIQGVAKALETEKTTWKNGKLTGVYHVPMNQLETGISMRDRHMKEKYLETEKYPKADLLISECAPREGDTTCEGSLTLHGVTKIVPMTVKWTKLSETKEAKTWKANTAFGIKLSDFGIAIPKFANITVAEDVKVEVESEAVQPST